MAERRRLSLLLAPLTAALFAAGVAACTSGAELPEFSAPVVDDAGVVSDSVEQAVSTSLESFRQTSGPQIAFAVVTSTGGASIEDYSIDLARHWGVGAEGRDDGVLVVIAVEDREMRIEVGSGVEGELTDLQAAEIIDQVMIPHMKADDVDSAVLDGAESLMRVWRGESLLPATPSDPVAASGDSSALVLVVAVLVFAIVAGLFILLGSGGPTGLGGGRYYTGYSASRGYGGGFSGGGFSGGGGGGFSGGGASGSW